MKASIIGDDYARRRLPHLGAELIRYVFGLMCEAGLWLSERCV
jgi:hypothetical protein